MKKNLFKAVILSVLMLVSLSAYADNTIMPAPKFHWEANGVAAVGWQLNTYEAGTLISLETFKGESGATNENPVVLDSDGNADIWLLDDSYKFVMMDKNSIIQWEVDDVVSISQLAATAAINAAIPRPYALLSEFLDLAIAVSEIGSGATELWIDQDDNSNATIPTTLTLRFIQGNTLSGVVTINSLPEAGRYRIFDAGASIALGQGVDAPFEWFGGVGDWKSGAGGTDNLAAFDDAIAALYPGAALIMSNGDYWVSDEVTFDQGMTVRALGKVSIVGSGNYALFHIDGSLTDTELIGFNSGTLAARTPFWLDNIGFKMDAVDVVGSIGLKITNTHHSKYELGDTNFFEKGIEVNATAGKSTFHNEFHPKGLGWNRYGIYVSQIGVAGGYVNSNDVIGGHYNSSAGVAWNGVNNWGIYIQGDAAGNSGSWFFDGMGMEVANDSDYFFFYLDYVTSSKFIFTHFETSDTTNSKITLTADSKNNQFDLPYSTLKQAQITGFNERNDWRMRTGRKWDINLQLPDEEWAWTINQGATVANMIRWLDSNETDTVWGLRLVDGHIVETFEGRQYGKQVYYEIADLESGETGVLKKKSWHLRKNVQGGDYANIYYDNSENYHYAGPVINGWRTSSSATPDVEGIAKLKLTGSQTVTNFLNGEEGQLLVITSTAGATLKENATINNILGSDLHPAAGEIITYENFDGTVWHQSGGEE